MTQAKQLFCGALLVATSVRCYLIWQSYCISSDGVVYLRTAQEMFAGNMVTALNSVYPPGYPLLITGLFPIIGNWELTGQIVSLIFGVGLLFPLYWMFQRLFNERIALFGCYVAAISPFLALYSAHVRSESSYLFFSTAALLLFLRGWQQRSKLRYLCGGICAGFAYLIRPEAIGYLAIVPMVEIVRWFFDRKAGLLWVIQTTALLYVGFLLFALPYIVYLSIDTGRIGAVSRKAGVTLAINLKEAGLLENEDGTHDGDVESLVFSEYVLNHPLLYARKIAADLVPAVGMFFAALHFPFVPFLLLGLVLAIREKFWHKPELLLIAVILVYVFGFALIYIKRRYSLQAVPVSLAWVSLGMVYLWDRLRESLSVRRARLLAATIAFILLATTLPKTLKPVSREKAYVREAGWYLKSRNKTGTLAVAVLDDRVTFYGEARTISITRITSANVKDYLRQQKADYFAAEAKAFAKLFPEVYQKPEDFGLVFERDFIGTRKDRMLLFRVT